jgi:hypothetical protein
MRIHSLHVIGLGLLLSLPALACKPCDSDALAYSLYNNSVVLVGKAVAIGEGPADVIAQNQKDNNMWKEKPYSVPVTIEIEEVISAGKEAGLKPGSRFETKSHHSPPCKSIALPKVGERTLFFPEDYGNCSSFAFQFEGDKVDGRTLKEVRALSAKRRR